MVDLVKNSAEFGLLANTLKNICGTSQPAFFINPGNWGDSLIRAGTLRFFSDHGLRCNVIYKKLYKRRKETLIPWLRRSQDEAPFIEFAKNHDIAIYSGGGYWAKSFSFGRQIVRLLAKHFRHVIVLPATYELERVPGPITYFCRDFFNSKDCIPDAIFCHDMAFFLSPKPRESTEEIGLFFRADRESRFKLGCLGQNLDISHMGDELSDPEMLFDHLGRFNEIATDRLHISIASALLGKTTYLLPNSYWKTEAIYRSTLKCYFPNVKFCPSVNDLPGRVRSSLSRS